MLDFKTWLEAVQTHFKWGDEDPGHVPGQKDPLGLPKLASPGFRKQDKLLITKDSKEVEAWVDEATKSLGVHWQIMYLAPTGLPETPVANSVRQMKQDAAPYWQQYKNSAEKEAGDVLQTFSKEQVLPPPSPANTIVYIKPTSRVHGLTKWQQIHNIGHAVWGANKPYLSQFVGKLRDTIYKLQQVHHSADGVKPSWSEMVVFMSRLLDLKSFQRIHSLHPGQLDEPKFRANTALNSFMESMFELIAVYLKNKGQIPFKPRGAVSQEKQMAVPDRRGEMTPNAEVVRKTNVRPWVWKQMPEGSDEAWQIARTDLTALVGDAIKNCVYAKAGPIYATQGYLTTLP